MRTNWVIAFGLFFLLGCGSGTGSGSNPQFQEDGLKDLLLSEDPLNGKLNQISFATNAPEEVEREFRLTLDKQSNVLIFRLSGKTDCKNTDFGMVEAKFLIASKSTGAAAEEWEYGSIRVLEPGEYRVKVQVRNPMKCPGFTVDFAVLRSDPFGPKIPRPDPWE